MRSKHYDVDSFSIHSSKLAQRRLPGSILTLSSKFSEAAVGVQLRGRDWASLLEALSVVFRITNITSKLTGVPT